MVFKPSPRNAMTFPKNVGNGLLNNLIAYWKLDETSGGISPVTRVDSVGSYDLSDNGNLPSGTGIINSCGQPNSPSTQYLLNASSSVNFYHKNFAASLWLKYNTSSSTNVNNCICIGSSVASGYQYFSVYFQKTTAKVTFRVRTATAFEDLTHSTVMSVGNWYHIVALYNWTTRVQSLYINNVSETRTTSGDTTLITPININCCGDPFNYFGASLDEIGIWYDLISSVQISQLYNSGLGLALSSFTT